MQNDTTQPTNPFDHLIEPPPIIRRDSLRAAILDIVRRVDWVTFAELPRRLAEVGHVNTRGMSSLELPGNIVLWRGLSADLVDAIRSLLEAKEIFLHPVELFIYRVDGAVLPFPLARRPPRGGYRKPHWAPVCLRPVAIGEATL